MDSKLYSTFYLNNKHTQLFCDKASRAFIQYRDFRINLLTGERENKDLDVFHNELELYKINQYFDTPTVIHFFYEYGFKTLNFLDYLDSSKPLAIFLDYSRVKTIDIYSFQYESQLKFKPLTMHSFEDYHTKFQKTYKKLLDGECYQMNLTIPFYLRANKSIPPKMYINKFWKDPLKVGAYAHGTYIDALGKLYLSNSPECLFQIVKRDKNYKILSMPIKGTLEVKNNDERKLAWDKLIFSKKDDAELNMITDLMRNDLSSITKKSSRVVFKKYPLHVPGLIHQFSVIESPIESHTSIREIMEKIFPGGSITGAPKRNVFKLISEIEKYERGFYCGSTLLMYKNSKSASINIRSAEIDYIQNEIRYGAGGGVTLLSQGNVEYNEALAKLKSFLLLLN